MTASVDLVRLLRNTTRRVQDVVRREAIGYDPRIQRPVRKYARKIPEATKYTYGVFFKIGTPEGGESSHGGFYFCVYPDPKKLDDTVQSSPRLDIDPTKPLYAILQEETQVTQDPREAFRKIRDLLREHIQPEKPNSNLYKSPP